MIEFYIELIIKRGVFMIELGEIQTLEVKRCTSVGGVF